MTFDLTFFLVYSVYFDILSDILSGILSGIYSDILSGRKGVQVQAWPTASGARDVAWIHGRGAEEKEYEEKEGRRRRKDLHLC